MINPDSNSDPEYLKTKTKDCEIKELNYKTETLENEFSLKPFKVDNGILERNIKV